MASLVQHNGFNIGRKIREYPFYTDSVRDLTHGEACSMPSALFFNYIAFERLYPFLVPFDDLIIDCDIISWLESWEILLTGQLFVYEISGVHNDVFTSRKFGRQR